MRRICRHAGAVVGVIALTAFAAAAAPVEKTVRDREQISRPIRIVPAPGAVAQPARPRLSATALETRFMVESGMVRFGAVLPDLPALVPTAMMIRVFSDGPWSLKLVPTSMLTIAERGELVSLSRLEWRSSRGGAFTAFAENAPVVIATGKATGPGGELVVVDLRLKIRDEDPLGNYACSFRVELDRNH